MNIQRGLRHLLTGQGQVRRAFPAAVLLDIAAAVTASERQHAGEIRVAIEGGLHARALLRDLTPRQRALQVFAELGVWDTEHNNGVLIYIQLADRSVELVVDRGLHQKAGEAAWGAICRQMEAEFRAGRFRTGVLAGIESLTRHLALHFPPGPGPHDELPDAPVILG